MSLALFKFGDQLPASMTEMQYIENTRENLAFSHALPPTSDEANFALRSHLIEDQEHRDWDDRNE